MPDSMFESMPAEAMVDSIVPESLRDPETVVDQYVFVQSVDVDGLEKQMDCLGTTTLESSVLGKEPAVGKLDKESVVQFLSSPRSFDMMASPRAVEGVKSLKTVQGVTRSAKEKRKSDFFGTVRSDFFGTVPAGSFEHSQRTKESTDEAIDTNVATRIDKAKETSGAIVADKAIEPEGTIVIDEIKDQDSVNLAISEPQSISSFDFGRDSVGTSSSSSSSSRPGMSDCKVPFVWRNVKSLNRARRKWSDITYLKQALGDIKSSFHKSNKPDLDFEGKNFKYLMLNFAEALEKMNEERDVHKTGIESDSGDYIYFRATNQKRKPTTLDNTLAPIQNDFEPPMECLPDMRPNETEAHRSEKSQLVEAEEKDKAQQPADAMEDNQTSLESASKKEEVKTNAPVKEVSDTPVEAEETKSKKQQKKAQRAQERAQEKATKGKGKGAAKDTVLLESTEPREPTQVQESSVQDSTKLHVATEVSEPTRSVAQEPTKDIYLSEIYSTVLRLCSPHIKIWLHYDVCDNVICQVSGRKRVVLIHPKYVSDLGVKAESSSSVYGSKMFDVGWLVGSKMSDESPKCHADKATPGFLRAWNTRYEVVLEPGDVLRIPALWLHCTEDVRSACTEELRKESVSVRKRVNAVEESEISLGERVSKGAKDEPIEIVSSTQEEAVEAAQEEALPSSLPVPNHGIGISINIFYKTTDLLSVYQTKDAWCNGDYVPFKDGLTNLEKCLSGMDKFSRPEIREFYLRKLKDRIDEELAKV